jgi:hypothetical protein
MIRYSLVCENGHAFDSWFSDSASYDTQARRGFVECPHCRSTRVSKALMAPAVSTSRRREARAAQVSQAPEAAPAAAPMALLDEKQQAMRAMIRDLHQKITENTVDVGAQFPDEARRMHDGEVPQRAIRGQATFEEAKALAEDGVPVLPIPSLPDERN